MTPTTGSSSRISDWETLAKALEDIRDAWLEISCSLSDIQAEVPSPLRDEAEAMTGKYLEGFRIASHQRPKGEQA